MNTPLSADPTSRLVEKVNARIPSSVTPETRIEIHPSEWLALADEFKRLQDALLTIATNGAPWPIGHAAQVLFDGGMRESGVDSQPTAKSSNERVSDSELRAILANYRDEPADSCLVRALHELQELRAERSPHGGVIPCWAVYPVTWHNMPLANGCAHCEIERLQADIAWIARMGVSIKTLPNGQRAVVDELQRPAAETTAPIPEGFTLYKRVGSILARPWTQQDAADYLNGLHTNVSVSEADKHTACVAQGMLAMNPDNSYDCWYIAPAYFAKHYASDSSEKTSSLRSEES